MAQINKELLVYGYIHENEKYLNILVPLGIIELIYNFSKFFDVWNTKFVAKSLIIDTKENIIEQTGRSTRTAFGTHIAKKGEVCIWNLTAINILGSS